MKIELKEITVRDLAEGYEDNDEDGVVGYAGKLDIRPPYPARVHLQGQAARRGHRHGHAGVSAQRHVLGGVAKANTERWDREDKEWAEGSED